METTFNTDPAIYAPADAYEKPNFDAQWDFEPWQQPESSDWRIWKPVPGSAIVFEKDRFGRILRPKAVVCGFTQYPIAI